MRMTQLKTIADIQTGPFGSQLHKEDYVETGTPIVTVEHLGNRVFTEQNLHTTDGCSRDVAYESAQLNWLILCTYIIISV